MKTITVKGVGKVSVKPDLIVVSMTLTSEDKEYEKTMELAAEKIKLVTEKIEKMRAFKESTDRFNNYDETYFCLEILANFTDDQDWECYYFKTKADRDEVIEQIITHPVFVETFDK